MEFRDTIKNGSKPKSNTNKRKFTGERNMGF